MKSRINVSLDEQTIAMLKKLAAESHTTASQWITDRVWEAEKRMQEDKRTNRKEG